MSSPPPSTVEVVTWREAFRSDFERLNRQWIEKDFHIEGSDLASLTDPHGTFVAPGGEVLFALVDGRVLGTCALRKADGDTYELCKMAVSPEARGRDLGDALMRAALTTARERGARRMYLVTNSALAPALGLYRKHGFVTTRSGPELAAATGYSRADVEMVVDL
ncbi:GNAT family N-acetyltransferase [Corallococcus sp. CA047B]|uniref:GNAT family N-acetyltransferase n=1 Tax=Corallococcus sp. CA047B TaxID=2316729 RepID=UPI000EA22EDC|nr:GNAT family N-acetyltransferase [Corallococcus sp. CA047B]RKH19250.1 GNAT family N-acetyltransferase [Corallococcus sp. CA047B]